MPAPPVKKKKTEKPFFKKKKRKYGQFMKKQNKFSLIWHIIQKQWNSVTGTYNLHNNPLVFSLSSVMVQHDDLYEHTLISAHD